MSYSLSYTPPGSGSGTSKTLAEWGISKPVIRLASFQADTLTFDVSKDHDAAADFAYGGTIALSNGGTTIFRGIVRGLPRQGSGTHESHTYVVHGPWDLLQMTPFLIEEQSYLDEETSLTVWSGRLFAHASESGAPVNTAAVIEDVLNYCAEACGDFFEVGLLPSSSPTVYVSSYTDRSCAEIITEVMRWMPDCVSWVDYSAGTPTINIQRRADLTAATIALTSGGVKLHDINPRHDLIPPVVAINYEITSSVDGSQTRSVVRDIYPSTSPAQPGAVVVTVPLRGASVSAQKQRVRTRPYPTDNDSANSPSGKSWFRDKVPLLKQFPGAALEFTAVSVEFAEGAPAAEPPKMDPAGDVWPAEITDIAVELDRELLDGSVEAWMGKRAVAATVKAVIWLPGTYDSLAATSEEWFTLWQTFPDIGVTPTGTKALRAEVAIPITATDSPTKNYVRSSKLTAGEAIPENLALAYHTALSTLHYEGSVTLGADEVPTTPYMSRKLNFSGGLSGWSSINALPKSVSMDLESGSTTIAFGPPSHLAPQDLVELMRVGRRNPPSAAYDRTSPKDEPDDVKDFFSGSYRHPITVPVTPYSPSPKPTGHAMVSSGRTIIHRLYVAEYGPRAVTMWPVGGSAQVDLGASVSEVYCTINTDESGAITSVTGPTSGATPASTKHRRPLTTGMSDAGQTGTYNIKIATVAGNGAVTPFVQGVIPWHGSDLASVWNVENAAGTGARVYDDSAGTGVPDSHLFTLRRIVAGTGAGGVTVNVVENANDIEISAELDAPTSGITGTFEWTDHVGSPHILTFTDGILTAATISGSPVTTWSISTLD